MTQQDLNNLIWSIANNVRGPYRPPQDRRVMHFYKYVPPRPLVIEAELRKLRGEIVALLGGVVL